jgi:predicted O-methyltransferase YrrM
MFGQNEIVKVDLVHAQLIGGLISSLKPNSILELGIGGGRVTDEILNSIEINQNNPKYTLVDNWYDFGFAMPNEVKEKYSDRINIVTSDEKQFIFSTQDKYDFVMSDADHHHTNEWFEYVYDELLLPEGILIYHDVNIFPEIEGSFVNLVEILDKCKDKNIQHKLFNKCTLPNERCYRGLLVIFKH